MLLSRTVNLIFFLDKKRPIGLFFLGVINQHGKVLNSMKLVKVGNTLKSILGAVLLISLFISEKSNQMIVSNSS
jgi:hypothetical protein